MKRTSGDSSAGDTIAWSRASRSARAAMSDIGVPTTPDAGSSSALCGEPRVSHGESHRLGSPSGVATGTLGALLTSLSWTRAAGIEDILTMRPSLTERPFRVSDSHWHATGTRKILPLQYWRKRPSRGLDKVSILAAGLARVTSITAVRERVHTPRDVCTTGRDSVR